MAASLARKEYRVAVALPDAVDDNLYYYGALWQGIREFLNTIPDFSFSVLEFAYPLSTDSNGFMLEQIYQEHSDRLDGLITIAMEDDRSACFIEKFAEKNIPVVLIGSDLYASSRLCCIKAHDEMAGCLAAELMTSFLPDQRPLKVILAGDYGYLGMRDQQINAQAFLSYLKKYAPFLDIFPFVGDSPKELAADIRDFLKKDSDVFAIYTCSARSTVYVTDVIRELGLVGRVRVIGNDLFSESAKALSDGSLQAVIDKKISRQSFLAVKTMFDYLVKKDSPHSDVLSIEPEVVLRSNVQLKNVERAY